MQAIPWFPSLARSTRTATRPTAVRCAVLVSLAVGSGTAAVAADRPLRETIDARVEAGWAKARVESAGLADDATFLRRVHLDLVGTVPTYDEARAFLGDAAADKRARLVDRLLDDPRFATQQGFVWDQVLFGRSPPGFEAKDRDGFRKWIVRQFAENVPYDRWAEALLKAEGSTVDDGAPMFLLQYDRRPEDATVAVTRIFLGMQLQCAQCHNHPFEDLSQVDFYGVAAFFARLQGVELGAKGKLKNWAVGEKEVGDVLFTGPVKDQMPGQKGEPVKPKFLKGDSLDEPEPPKDAKPADRLPSGKMPPKPAFSRKDKLAEWIVRPDNPWFAKAVANRVWAQFLGHGLVHPVDNLSPANVPSHPELLDELAAAIVAHGFDLKWFVRELCNSRTYQMADTGPVAAAKPLWFERARVRPLAAEELIAAWRTAGGFEHSPAAKDPKNADPWAPLGSGYMLSFFGRPEDGVGDFQGGLHEHLYLNNGPLSQLITFGKGSLHESLSSSSAPWEERVDRLFVSVLSRPPVAEERAKFVEFLSAPDDVAGRLAQAIWVLMTCSEFRFNH